MNGDVGLNNVSQERAQLVLLLLKFVLNLLWLIKLYQPQDIFVFHDTLNKLLLSNFICKKMLKFVDYDMMQNFHRNTHYLIISYHHHSFQRMSRFFQLASLVCSHLLEDFSGLQQESC